ncbi:hypothetical protein BZA77DRAFT_139653, partial [Pyronema omphalodes]
EVLIHILSFLDPQTLLTVAALSKRFHALVTSTHAWRSAFVRFFPPPHAQVDDHGSPLAGQDKRYFTRLYTAEESENAWRKEYTHRTRLLRKLGRGTHRGLVVLYPARQGPLSVSHMAASFSSSGIRAVHACLDVQWVNSSDPTSGKIEAPRPAPIWSYDIAPRFRPVQVDHPDHQVAAEMGTTWVMDISEEMGWVMGENVPDGMVQVHPYSQPYLEMHVSTLTPTNFIRPGTDRPYEPEDTDNRFGHKPLVTCLWIAKKRAVVDSTGAAVIVGNSRGFIRVFTIIFGKKTNTIKPVASYCISPGVPIVQVKVDEDFLPRRHRQKRPWLTAINALGEVYYLRTLPGAAVTADWKLVPHTERIATPLYFEVFPEITEGTPDKEKDAKLKQRDNLLLKMDYSMLRELWEGCGMDWFLEVDWAGDNIIAGRKGLQNKDGNAGHLPKITRYHLKTVQPNQPKGLVSIVPSHTASPIPSLQTSIFGGGPVSSGTITPLADQQPADSEASGEAEADAADDDEPAPRIDSWSVTTFFLHNTFTLITCSAIDASPLARLTASEDPTLRASVPGGNARLFAVGTNTGSIFIFNCRAPLDPITLPLRVIHTDSPVITTLGVSSLAVIHGGDDGLVQAWDPLASTEKPVRTIHSRFSARARRRLEQHAGTDTAGLGDNQFAARCLVLDPDPTNLRGIVALGTFVKYWSLQSDALVKKHRKGAATGGGKHASRNAVRTKGEIRDAIVMDQKALKAEKERREKEELKLKKRFGVEKGASAMTEEEMLAYATMISQEAFEQERSRMNELESMNGFKGLGSELGSSTGSNEIFTPSESARSDGTVYETPKEESQEDRDLELALRLSLMEQEGSSVYEHSSNYGTSYDTGKGRWEEDFSPSYQSPAGSSSYNTGNHNPWTTPYLSPQTPSTPSRSKPASRSSFNTPQKKKGWNKVSLDELEQVEKAVGGYADREYRMDTGYHAENSRAFEEDLELAIRLSLQESEAATEEGKGKGRA